MSKDNKKVEISHKGDISTIMNYALCIMNYAL